VSTRNLKLQVLLDTIDRATKPLKKIAAGSKGAGAAIRETRDHLRKLESAQKDLKGFANLKRSSDATAASLEEQQRKVRDLTRQIENAEGSTKQLTRQRSAAINQAKKLKTQYGKEQEQLQQLRGKMKQVHGLTGSLSDQQRQLTDNIGAANKRLKAQQTALDRLGKAKVGEKFQNMRSEVGRFARQAVLAGTIAGGSIFAVANSTATLGDDVAKTADKIGIAMGPFQELRYAAERSGVSTEKFDSSLERFIKRTGEATMGTGAARKAFDELGLSAEDLANMAPEAAMGVVADGLAAVDSQTRRVALAAQIFGREGVAMVNMMKDGSAGLEELRRQGRLTGYVLSEQAARDAETFKDNLLDAQLGMQGLKNILGAELMPVISDLMREFSEWMIENREQVTAFSKRFAEGFREAIPTLLSLARGLASMASTLASVTGVLAGLVGGFDNLGVVLAVLWALKPVITIAAFVKSLFLLSGGMATFAKVLPLVTKGLALAMGGLKALSMFLLTNPIGWAIAAIATAAFLIIKFWDPIKNFFAGFWSELKQAFAGGIGGITKFITDWSPMGLFYRAFAGVLSWFGVDLPSQFSDFGTMIMDGLKNGILNGLTATKDAITGAGDAVIGWFKDKLGINSPSRVFAEFGTNTMQGYEQGIKAAEKAPVRQIGDVAKRIGRAGAGIALGGAFATSAAALPGSIGIDAPNSIPLDTRGPMAAGSRSVIVQGDNITLNVYPSPGMDEQALAAYIERILDARDQRKAARMRSALHDLD
jgi:predicted  nucleic acid-binding Zn-ribbon protein